VKIFYTDRFVLPLPSEHRFPMSKYRRVRERLQAHPGLQAEFQLPAAATRQELCGIHEPGYVERVFNGDLTPAEVRRLGFPWSPELVERSRRSVGATIAVCRAALCDGVAVNLAGGTHHAFADRGEGYCVFNDAAVAIRIMLDEGRIERALVVDCDVHQGNGTAAIFAAEPRVFTLSLHGARNYPFRKERSDVDVALDDGTDDATYLAALRPALEGALAASCPQLAVYVSGADPFEGDRLGRLALTKAGLRARDETVFELLGRQYAAAPRTAAAV